jgi:hypothetical protein
MVLVLPIVLPTLFLADMVQIPVDDPAPPPRVARVEPSSTWRQDHWRLEGAIGMRLGSMFFAGQDVGTTTPVHFDLGMRERHWLLYGEYDLNGFSWPAGVAASGTALTGSTTGLLQRVGGNARVELFGNYESDFDSNIWLEAGAGMQHVSWDGGGTWTRGDLAFGIGGTVLGKSEDRHWGLTAGLRVSVARRDQNRAMEPTATCAGPCDTATAPSTWDRSIMFDMAFNFGT